MKKQIVIIGIILMLLTIGLSGCTEQNQKLEEEFVSAPLNILGLTLDDLPEGYEIEIEEYEDYRNFESPFPDGPGYNLEIYQIMFTYNGTELNKINSIIDLSMLKYNSLFNATSVMGYNELFCSDMYSDNYTKSSESIGDYSFIYGKNFSYEEDDMERFYAFGMFRISNVLVTLTISLTHEVDPLTTFIYYARIIEERIDESLE